MLFFLILQDLGGLLKSLYDAVAISLPQKGTKTLKLRLTLSPDKTSKVHPIKNFCKNLDKFQNNQINHDKPLKLNKDQPYVKKQNVKSTNLSVSNELETEKQNIENQDKGAPKAVKTTNQDHHGKKLKSRGLEKKRHLSELDKKNNSLERPHTGSADKKDIR